MTSHNLKNALSTLAETTDEYIKLECARRRNQPVTRRRSMLQEHFQVAIPMSRLKARMTQTRHHEFLVRKENRAELNAIIDSVRDLVEECTPCPSARSAGNSTSDYRRGSAASSAVLNPMECSRLLAWAADTERILTDFEPSDSHENDPIVRVVEQLQQLQDGHVCLSEIVVDARTLLERWESVGVFDSQFDGDNTDSDDDTGPVVPNTHPVRVLDKSYAYQNIRQRAAANCIKRNVLKWVRAKDSFLQRVSEIELFGRTTESFLKELSSTVSSPAAPTAERGSSPDIFLVVRGRRVDRFGNSIALTDLMHFAKHVAVFPVDQALRSLDAMARKRRLLDFRSAIKIQSTWRKAKSVLQARRLFLAMEQLRIQREREEAELAEALARAKAQTPHKSGKHKGSKTTAGKKVRNSLALLSASAPDPDANGEARERSRSISAALTSRVRASMVVTKRKESKVVVDDKDTSGSPAGTPSGRSRHQGGISGSSGGAHDKNEEDDSEDTSDVVNAWQAFLDSVKAQEEENAETIEEEEKEGEEESVVTHEVEAVVSPAQPDVAPEAIEALTFIDTDDWRNWSDEETTELASNDATTASHDEKRPLTEPESSSRRDTKRQQRVPVRAPSRQEAPRSSTATEGGTSRRRVSKQPAADDKQRATRVFNSIVSTADLIKRLEQRPRLDRPSMLSPFSDWDTTQKSAPSTAMVGQTSTTVAPMTAVGSTRSPRHFHEMDFHQLYLGVEEFCVAPSLTSIRADEVEDVFDTLVRQPEATGAAASASSVVSMNRVYRRRQQLQTQAIVAANQTTASVYGENNEAAHRHESRLRVYRAPASRAQVVVKRSQPPEASDHDATQQQPLAEHVYRKKTVESQKNVVGSLSSIEPIPPCHPAIPRLPMPRKRRLRPPQGKVAQRNDGAELPNEPGTRSPQPTPTLRQRLPQVQPTSFKPTSPENVSSVKLDSELETATPKPLMQAVRRTLRFKTNGITTASASNEPSIFSQPGYYFTGGGSCGSRPFDQTSQVMREHSTIEAVTSLPMQCDIDWRFHTPEFRATSRDSTKTRVLHPPRHLTATRASRDNEIHPEAESEWDAISYDDEYGGDVDSKLEDAGFGFDGTGSHVPDILQESKSTAEARPDPQAVCPEIMNDTSHCISNMEYSKPERWGPRSALPSATNDADAPARTKAESVSLQPLQGRMIPRGVPIDASAVLSKCASRRTREEEIHEGEAPPICSLAVAAVPPSIERAPNASHQCIPADDSERLASFNRLFQQYLGLLQCSPAGAFGPRRVDRSRR